MENGRANSAEKTSLGSNDQNLNGITYSEHLQLPKLLDCQQLLSTAHGNTVDEEHMFIITHQTYELWFKQVIYDIDCLRHLFQQEEVNCVKIVKILERIKRIIKLLINQLDILETMTPSDFINFRCYLKCASGYQSFQFRMIENKLGVQHKNRICYNQENYKEIFEKSGETLQKILRSEHEPSLFDCVQNWLSTLLNQYSPYFLKYTKGVQLYLEQKMLEMNEAEFVKIQASYKTVLDQKLHNSLIKTGDRRLRYEAFQCALCILFYPRFNTSHNQILELLIEIDSTLTKWRHNHCLLAQKMLGVKHGTGGSSGYSYLRATVSDRYKVFLDLVNISNWVIPEECLEDGPGRDREIKQQPK